MITKFLSLFAMVFMLNFMVDAATIGVSSDFLFADDGWERPTGSSNQTQVVTDFFANGFLLVSSSGAAGAGGRLVVPNVTVDWTGDYTSAGITAISIDIRNSGNINPLFIRVAIDGAGGRWVTSAAQVLSPSDSGVFLFGLNSNSLISAGGTDVAASLADVSQIRVLHSVAGGSFQGDQVAGEFELNNVSLVPEPSSLMYLGCSIFFLSMRRQRQVEK